MPAPTAVSQDVANIIPERCADPSGDFTVSTNPKQASVNSIIAEIVQEVQAVVGASVDASLASFATLVVATGAAAQVELAFTNDLAADRESKYQQLQDLYGARLARLKQAQETLNSGGTLGDTEPRNAQFTLPDIEQVGFPATRWGTGF